MTILPSPVWPGLTVQSRAFPISTPGTTSILGDAVMALESTQCWPRLWHMIIDLNGRSPGHLVLSDRIWPLVTYLTNNLHPISTCRHYLLQRHSQSHCYSIDRPILHVVYYYSVLHHPCRASSPVPDPLLSQRAQSKNILIEKTNSADTINGNTFCAQSWIKKVLQFPGMTSHCTRRTYSLLFLKSVLWWAG